MIGAGLWVRSRWDQLPQRFPSHWGADGTVDAWSTPGDVLGVAFAVLAGVNLPLLVVASVSRIDLLTRRILLLIGSGVLGMSGTAIMEPVIRMALALIMSPVAVSLFPVRVTADAACA